MLSTVQPAMTSIIILAVGTPMGLAIVFVMARGRTARQRRTRVPRGHREQASPFSGWDPSASVSAGALPDGTKSSAGFPGASLNAVTYPVTSSATGLPPSIMSERVHVSADHPTTSAPLHEVPVVQSPAPSLGVSVEPRRVVSTARMGHVAPTKIVPPPRARVPIKAPSTAGASAPLPPPAVVEHRPRVIQPPQLTQSSRSQDGVSPLRPSPMRPQRSVGDDAADGWSVPATQQPEQDSAIIARRSLGGPSSPIAESGWLSSQTIVMSEELRRAAGLEIDLRDGPVAPPAWLAPKRFGSITDQRMQLSQFNRIGRADPSATDVEIDLTGLPGAEHSSRHHGTIQYSNGAWVLSDPGSVNGVFVRAPGQAMFSPRLVQPVQITGGTEIAFGNVVVVFLDS